jgi:hypothetical protein
VGAETVAGVTGAISGGINTAAQTVATEKGAQGLQNQAQNIMQNQANNAYTDPSQFDGLIDYNAESIAEQRQAMSDFIKQRGMGNAANADLAEIKYRYGVNSTLGASGGYTHQTIYSSEQYSDFKKDWSNATTVEARTNVLMKLYSEGLSNIDNMNISGTEKAKLKAKLLQGFYGAV